MPRHSHTVVNLIKQNTQSLAMNKSDNLLQQTTSLPEKPTLDNIFLEDITPNDDPLESKLPT